MSFARSTLLVIIAALLSGCATILTPVPPADYHDLTGNRTLRVTTHDGDYRETSSLAVHDSTLTILKPRAALHDPRDYPVSYRFSEIQSVSTIKQESLVYIESGVEHHENVGGEEAHYFSPTVLVIELGYLSGERKRPEHPRWGFGGTLMTMTGEQDLRIGVRGRVRYRWNRHFSTDLSAGPMLKSWKDGFFRGFIGGVNLNAGSFFTVRTEYMTFEYPAWTESGYPGPNIYHPEGTEAGWYYGVAFRGTLGWVTAGVGSAALFVIIMSSLAALGG